MSVIPITLFCSLLLAGIFVVLFAREHRRRRFASAERDSLLPLADERPHTVISAPSATEVHDHADDDHDHGHDHAGGPCGCRTGVRPPCVGCLRRRDQPAPLSS